MLVRGAAGRPVRHHRTYELTLWNGRILRTRISKPVDGSTYGPSMWAHILREQLEATRAEFWACVNDGLPPDRGAPAVVVPTEALPLYLYRALVGLGVTEDELRGLGPAAAAALHARLLAQSESESSDL